MTDKKYNVELSEREIMIILNLIIDKVNYGGTIRGIREYIELHDKLIEIS